MAETPPKRHREDDGESEIRTTKRQISSYINEQQETTQDLFDFLTNLSDPFLSFIQQPESDPNHNSKIDYGDDDEKESVIRHLYEASDDELGIPSRVDNGGDGGSDGGGDSGKVVGEGYGDFPVDLCDGLWEIEDEAADYYTLLQSELFML